MNLAFKKSGYFNHQGTVWFFISIPLSEIYRIFVRQLEKTAVRNVEKMQDIFEWN